jgi:AcrR family transcriptional regulator
MDSSLPRRRPPTRSAQKLARHRKIVRAAERLFGVKGYEATAMEDVARAARLAVGTIYNYFPSKTDLVLAIVRRETEELYARGDRIAADPPADPVAALAGMCSVMVDGFLRDDRALMREVFAAAVNSPQTIGARVFESDLRLVSLLVRLIEKLKAGRLLDANLDAIRAAGVLYGICMTWITAYLMNDALTVEMVQDEVRRGIEIATRGMLTPPRGAKAAAMPPGEAT